MHISLQKKICFNKSKRQQQAQKKAVGLTRQAGRINSCARFNCQYFLLRQLTELTFTTRHMLCATNQSSFIRCQWSHLAGKQGQVIVFMGKLQLTGQNQGRIFNFTSVRVHAVHLLCYRAKLPNLKLITRPRQLLGSFPLDIALTVVLLQYPYRYRRHFRD